jgi:hypothetical protein
LSIASRFSKGEQTDRRTEDSFSPDSLPVVGAFLMVASSELLFTLVCSTAVPNANLEIGLKTV